MLIDDSNVTHWAFKWGEKMSFDFLLLTKGQDLKWAPTFLDITNKMPLFPSLLPLRWQPASKALHYFHFHHFIFPLLFSIFVLNALGGSTKSQNYIVYQLRLWTYLQLASKALHGLLLFPFSGQWLTSKSDLEFRILRSKSKFWF